MYKSGAVLWGKVKVQRLSSIDGFSYVGDVYGGMIRLGVHGLSMMW